MSEEVVSYITEYGYIAIFILVFLQEIGIPIPIPSEIALLFSGYLSFKGLLHLYFVILTAISSVLAGTLILYTVFYSTGRFLIQRKPKWFPVSDKMINRLTENISKGGHLSIYLFRMISFTRGYSSIITGLLHIKPRIFLPIALISASAWVGVYVILGYFLGPSWDIVIRNIGSFKYIMFGILLVLIFIFLFTWIRKTKKNRMKRQEPDMNTDLQ
jgi:membrane protein DedA with SNARE-associated domain